MQQQAMDFGDATFCVAESRAARRRRKSSIASGAYVNPIASRIGPYRLPKKLQPTAWMNAIRPCFVNKVDSASRYPSRSTPTPFLDLSPART
eukprot:437199-Pyramimonas_sp.AAC.1